MLKIEHLSKSFKDRKVLDDLNLEIGDGSVFGLVGVNGAGKSTLLRLTAGVYRADAGSILLDGKDTYLCPEVRRRIAFVPDEQYFPIGATIRSVRELYSSMYDFDQAAFQKYCRLFELQENMTVLNLSKGMKKRVSLLFALSIHPGLLLLDEAYDGLEPLARLRFRRVLADLIEEENISVIISSHNLKELEDICDSYGILENGKMLTYGDLLDSKEKINKYQAVFSEEKNREDFPGYDMLHFEKEGRVCRMVIRGSEDEIRSRLAEMHPLLLDVLNVDFEELFIYELESRGEDNE